MPYHEAIIDLIKFILLRGKEFVSLIDSGNAYDKILRNYHQFNIKGEKVYRNKKLMQRHYRFSENAWLNKNDIDKLYFEHLYPVKLIKRELNELNTIDNENIKRIIDKTEIIVILKDESKKIDAVYKDDIPQNGKNRLEFFDIKIHFETKNNNLFKV
jgi:hypothetical protein